MNFAENAYQKKRKDFLISNFQTAGNLNREFLLEFITVKSNDKLLRILARIIIYYNDLVSTCKHALDRKQCKTYTITKDMVFAATRGCHGGMPGLKIGIV